MAMWVNINSNGKTKFLKLKLKWGARFALIEKNNVTGKYDEVGKTKIVNGALKSIKHKVFNYEWNDINTISLELVDNEETFVVDLNNESGIARSIISSLLSLKELWKIMQLSLYSKKYTDKDGQPQLSDAIWLTYDWEMLKWFYNIADKTDEKGLPAIEEKTIKGKKTFDSYNRDMFLLSELQAHIEKLPEPETLDDMPDLTSVVDDSQDVEDAKEVFDTPTEDKNIEDQPF